ncbi:CYTH domain-containing protein [Candidatus Saccharibacteria bacterium]|nr:CYTH domain-containing protein [Candidatus Saccharibacteria bacterium]
MKLEIEAVFCDIDKNALRDKLKSLGAKLIAPERKMIRTVFHFSDERPHSFVRVRDEGDKIVLTFKEVHDGIVIGKKEINIIVDDYDATVELMRVLGLREKSYEESMRESWMLDGAEIDIDTWPWLPPYAEVEGTSVENMTAVSEKLGFNMSDALYGSVGLVYEKYYDISQDDLNAGRGIWSRIEFKPIPDYLASKKKMI